MRFTTFFIVILCLQIVACKPKPAIPLPKMAEIMVDMHLADAYAALVFQQDTAHVANNFNKNLDTLQLYYAKVFAQYHVSESTYMLQLKEYQQQAPVWDSLYSLVQKRLATIRPKDMH